MKSELLYYGSWALVAIAVVGLIFGAGKWVGAVNADRKTFHNFIEEVRADIKAILKRLPKETMAGASPLRLTDLGEEVSERIGAKALAEGLLPAVRDQVAGKSAYDVQEECFAYVRGKWDIPEETEQTIRDCAFENGLSREKVVDVIALELRDLLLPESGDA